MFLFVSLFFVVKIVDLFTCRYCLWVLGNGATLTNNDSVWKKLVQDAQNRGCYFDVREDTNLVKSVIDTMVELDQLNELMNTSSLLFKNARWKVCCSHVHSFLYLLILLASVY